MSLRQNPPPVESPSTRFGLVTAYKALRALDEAGYLAYIAEALHDPQAAEQCDEAIASIEASMSPNLLVTVLPAYTRVRFATDKSREGEFVEGQIRDGAWGLYPDRSNSTERRITTTSGFEFFVTPETVFTYFEIIERPAVAA